MADQDNTQKQGTGAPDTGAEIEEKPKSGKRFIVFAVVLLLVLGAGYWYWRGTFSEETDDAQVDGDIYQISSRIPGQVTRVYVQDNKPVNKGDLLLEIDPKDFQVALEQAQAQLANAQASYQQATVNVPITTETTSTTVSNSGTDVRGSQSAVDQAQQQAAAAATSKKE